MQVGLAPSDLARSMAFYRDEIGLAVRELRPGLRVAIIEDPDGNAIELVERALIGQWRRLA